MSEVGIHNFVDAIGHYKNEVASSDGGLWIVMMDGLLLIPLAMAAFFYPVAAFARSFLLKKGFLDGVPGLIIAMQTAYGVFLKYAKLWELNNIKK